LEIAVVATFLHLLDPIIGVVGVRLRGRKPRPRNRLAQNIPVVVCCAVTEAEPEQVARLHRAA
jgi:hypothetical protein